MYGNNYVNADDVIGRMYATVEEAAALIDHVEAEYFTGETNKDGLIVPSEEALKKLVVDYSKAGKMLRAALDLLYIAVTENERWQNRPADQLEAEAKLYSEEPQE